MFDFYIKKELRRENANLKRRLAIANQEITEVKYQITDALHNAEVANKALSYQREHFLKRENQYCATIKALEDEKLQLKSMLKTHLDLAELLKQKD